MHALLMQCSLVLTLSPAVSHSRSNTRTLRRNTRWTGAVRSARETVCSQPSRRPCYRPAVSVWTRTPLRSPYPALLRPDPLYRRPVARKWSRSTLLWWWGSPSSAITSESDLQLQRHHTSASIVMRVFVFYAIYRSVTLAWMNRALAVSKQPHPETDLRVNAGKKYGVCFQILRGSLKRLSNSLLEMLS